MGWYRMGNHKMNGLYACLLVLSFILIGYLIKSDAVVNSTLHTTITKSLVSTAYTPTTEASGLKSELIKISELKLNIMILIILLR